MKRKRRAKSTASEDFLRGFFAAGLLSAVQNRNEARLDQRSLRLGLQGGISLAAASAAASSLRRGGAGKALLALSLGVAGVAGVERLLAKQCTVESHDGQEEK